MSRPANSMRPVVGTKPVMPSMKVVLPAPLGPIRPTSCPYCTEKSTSLTALRPPNVTDMLVVCSKVVISGHPLSQLQ